MSSYEILLNRALGAVAVFKSLRNFTFTEQKVAHYYVVNLCSGAHKIIIRGLLDWTYHILVHLF